MSFMSFMSCGSVLYKIIINIRQIKKTLQISNPFVFAFFLFIFIYASLDLPPCWKTVEAAKAWINSGLQDVSYPKCDKDGYFTPLQCQPVGGCYCVDKYGNLTTKPRGRFFGRPDCRKSTPPKQKR